MYRLSSFFFHLLNQLLDVFLKKTYHKPEECTDLIIAQRKDALLKFPTLFFIPQQLP